ncbi:MAG: hypothetical protein KGO82_20950 [Bacteroidota bacterium]|nr:hypothetical protein [Bacteroidota bacterium]
MTTIATCIVYLLSGTHDRQYRFLAAGWAVVLLFDLSMVLIGYFHPVKNHWVYNIAFPLIQLLSMTVTVFGQYWLRYPALALIGFVIWNLAAVQGATTLNTYSIAMGGIMILVVACIRLSQLAKIDTGESLFTDPDFLFCAGCIVYWGIMTPFYAMYNFLWENFSNFLSSYFFTISLGATIALNYLVIKALRCKLRTARK